MRSPASQQTKRQPASAKVVCLFQEKSWKEAPGTSKPPKASALDERMRSSCRPRGFPVTSVKVTHC